MGDLRSMAPPSRVHRMRQLQGSGEPCHFLVAMRRLILLSFLVFSCTNAQLAVADVSTIVRAAGRQEWDRVAEFLQQGANLSAAQPDGMTALHWATHWDRLDIVQQLLAAGLDAEARNQYEVTPLAIACLNGDHRVISALLSAGADARDRLPGGETMLMRAARTGKSAAVRLLVEHGADVNAKDRRGQTALMWAAAEGNTGVIGLLLKSGANRDAKTSSGFTAMMFAAREGRISTARRLLDAGVDVNAIMQPKNSQGRAPRWGMTALMLAVESGHFELAAMLLDRGSDPNDQRSGFTPLHALSWVRKANRGDNVEGDPEPRGSGNMTSLDFVRKCVAAGGNVNARLWNGHSARAELGKRLATSFLLASNTADLPLMRLLVELGADPNIPNADGCTPLMAAAGIGVVAVGEEAGTETEVLEAIELLLELGADINAVDKNNQTAMHGAAYRNYPRVVQLLARHGSDSKVWNRKNRWGSTPVAIAQGRRPGSLKPSPETVAALEAAM